MYPLYPLMLNQVHAKEVMLKLNRYQYKNFNYLQFNQSQQKTNQYHYYFHLLSLCFDFLSIFMDHLPQTTRSLNFYGNFQIRFLFLHFLNSMVEQEHQKIHLYKFHCFLYLISYLINLFYQFQYFYLLIHHKMEILLNLLPIHFLIFSIFLEFFHTALKVLMDFKSY